MPFQLRNAPETFQHTIHVILVNVKWHFAFANLDSIVMFSKTTKQYINYVREVLSLLNSAGSTLKIKCIFFSNSVEHLGHVLRYGRLQLASHTTDTMRELKPPTSITVLGSFLGLCSHS